MPTPYPDNFSAQEQFRAQRSDETLQAKARAFVHALLDLENARTAHIAQNLTALWPVAADGWVHKDPNASTKQEQLDLSNAILSALATCLNQGSAPSTPAQVAAVWNRYVSR